MEIFAYSHSVKAKQMPQASDFRLSGLRVQREGLGLRVGGEYSAGERERGSVGVHTSMGLITWRWSTRARFTVPSPLQG